MTSNALLGTELHQLDGPGQHQLERLELRRCQQLVAVLGSGAVSAADGDVRVVVEAEQPIGNLDLDGLAALILRHPDHAERDGLAQLRLPLLGELHLLGLERQSGVMRVHRCVKRQSLELLLTRLVQNHCHVTAYLASHDISFWSWERNSSLRNGAYLTKNYIIFLHFCQCKYLIIPFFCKIKQKTRKLLSSSITASCSDSSMIYPILGDTASQFSGSPAPSHAR
jgi:hypothetical protein